MSNPDYKIPKKLLKHPKFDTIVQKLSQGESLDKVIAWLNKRYSKKQIRFRMCRKTLQDFRSEYLDLKGDALKEVMSKRREADKGAIKETIRERVKNLPSYKAAMEDVIVEELDKEKRIKQMDRILENQIMLIGNMFDDAIDRDDGDLDYKKFSRLNNNLIKNIEQWRNLMHDYAKLIEKQSDYVSEHNINVSVVNNEMLALRNAVIEVLRLMEPDLQAIFLTKLDDEMKKIGSVDDAEEAEFKQIKEG